VVCTSMDINKRGEDLRGCSFLFWGGGGGCR